MKKLIFFLLLSISVKAFAQQQSAKPAKPDTAGTKAKKTAVTQPAQQPKAVKPAITKASIKTKVTSDVVAEDDSARISALVQVGSQGLGAEVKYGFLPNVSLRFGGSFIPPATANNVYSFGSFQSSDQLRATFANVHLLADYVPLPQYSFLRLVGGVGYIIKGNAVMDIEPTGGTYQVGQMKVTQDQIGSVRAEVNWKGVAPYLGLGIFKSFPDQLFNFNVDLGTYYMGSPTTNLTGTKTLSVNSQQNPQFQDNMKGYHWLPVLQVSFNYRIK